MSIVCANALKSNGDRSGSPVRAPSSVSCRPPSPCVRPPPRRWACRRCRQCPGGPGSRRGAWARRWGPSNSGTGSSPWRVGGHRLWLGLGSGSGSGERGEGVRSGRIRSGGRVRRGVWSGSESGPGRFGSGQRVAPGARRWGDSEEGWPRVIAGSSQSGRIWTVASSAGASKPLNGLRLTKGRWSKKRRSPSGSLMFPRFRGVDVSTKAGQDHWRPG
jgi:hypothetical protein